MQVWRKMHICLQPAGDRRLDRGKKGTAGQVLPAWSISGPTGPGEQHQRPFAGTQGHVYLPLPGQCAHTVISERFKTEDTRVDF